MSDLTKFLNDKIEEDRDNLDFECYECIEGNINLCVPWFLMAAYAYYVEDDPIISDACFDKIAKRMYEEWENIEHHHKYLINKDDLRAGSYLGEYPKRVEGGLQELRKVYGKQKTTGSNS